MAALGDYLSLAALRHCFYLVSPAESTFASVQDVPSYTDMITPVFLVLFFAEALLMRAFGAAPAEGTDFRDSLTNFVCMIFCTFFHRLARIGGVSLLVYIYVYENYRIVDIAWDNYYVWFVCLVAWDFTWYWLHRAAHEVSILWSFHQIHHSSEYFNLGIAMRAGVFVDNPLVMTFQLWQALFVPPQIYLVHTQLNVIAQIWTHCAVIPKIPLLDYVINTPSLHRVHHGRNPYCIDKNYGGIFSIWDRIFGTLQEEKDEEQVHYGLISHVDYYDCVKLQFQLLKYYAFDKPVALKGNMIAKLKAIVYPPAWDNETTDKELVDSALWKRMKTPSHGVPQASGTRGRRVLPYSKELVALFSSANGTKTADTGCKAQARLQYATYALNAYALIHFLLLTACLDSRRLHYVFTGNMRTAFNAYGILTLYMVTAALDQRLYIFHSIPTKHNFCTHLTQNAEFACSPVWNYFEMDL